MYASCGLQPPAPVETAPSPPAPASPAPAAKDSAGTTTRAANRKLGNDGRMYHCCDNADCSPGSPGYSGDCDVLRPDCNNIVCPPYVSAPPIQK